MKRDEAVLRIQRNLGFRKDLDAVIIDALQDSQEELEREPFLPWFLREDDFTSLATTADVEKVALPAGFLREVEDDGLYYYDTTEATYTSLGKEDIEFLRRVLPGTGAPQAYWLSKDSIFIFPTPDAIYTLRLIYYKADTKLATNVENAWLKHAFDLVIGVAGQKVAAPIRDANAFNIFKEMEAKARARMLADSEAREHEHRRYIMGGVD